MFEWSGDFLSFVIGYAIGLIVGWYMHKRKYKGDAR